MRDKLRRLNLVESQTATTWRAAFTIARFTRDSSKLGVVRPTSGSKPSTPRKRMSACISWRTFGQRPHQRERILAQAAAHQDDFEVGAGEFDRDVHGVGDHRELGEAFKLVRNGGGGRSGIQHDALALLDHLCGRHADPLLFLGMLLLLFLQSRIEKGAGLDAKGSTVRPLHEAFALEVLQILADGDLRDPQIARDFANQHTTLALNQGEDVLPALIDQKLSLFRRPGMVSSACHEFRLLSFEGYTRRRASS